MGLGDFFRERAFVEGGNILGMAEAFDKAGHYGPAVYLYRVAHEKLDLGQASTANLVDIGSRMRYCAERARERGEDISFANQPSIHDIGRYPDHYLRWYYDQQAGRHYDWCPPTAEELAAENRRQLEAQHREQKKEQARKQRELDIRGKKLFRKRFNAMLEATARVADGSDRALEKAVSLYCRPEDREDWGEPWSEFARESLKMTIEKRARDPRVAKALSAMPRVAFKAEGMNVWLYVGIGLGTCLIWPVSWSVAALIAWSGPESDGLPCYMTLVWAALGLVALVFYCVAWLAKWLTVPWLIGWTITILVYFLPRHLRARRAIAASDITLMEIDKLFAADGGRPIEK